MRIRNLFIAFSIIILASLAHPVVAQEQETISLKNVLLSVYPEYDDLANLGFPSVLVIYEGEVASDNVPVTFRFLIPSNAVLNAVAYLGPQNQYLEGNPNRGSSNTTGWDEVSFELQSKYFLVEYYAPVFGQPDRAISYDFRPLYTINGLRAEVQEPKRSKNFRVSPDGPVRTDDKGFKYHTYEFGSVSPDAPLHFDISYTKADSRPSVGSSNPRNTIIIIVSGAIVILTVAFILMARLKLGRKLIGTRSARRRAARTARQGQASPRGKYCPACGKEIQRAGNFCAYCGEELD